MRVKAATLVIELYLDGENAHVESDLKIHKKDGVDPLVLYKAIRDTGKGIIKDAADNPEACTDDEIRLIDIQLDDLDPTLPTVERNPGGENG